MRGFVPRLLVFLVVLSLLSVNVVPPALADDPVPQEQDQEEEAPVDQTVDQTVDEPAVAPEPEVTPEPAQQPAAPVLPPYSAVGLRYGPNCSITRAIVYLQDSNGRFVNGIVVRLETRDGTWGANSYPTGGQGYEPGTTDFTLPGAPEDRTWNLFVVDGAGNKASGPFQFTTQSNSVDCNWDQPGRQVAWITFQQNLPGAVAVPQPERGIAPQDANLPFRFGGLDWDDGNCGMTRITVFVKDQNGAPLDGVRFRIETAGGGWNVDSYPTGQDDLADGFTDFYLRAAAFANTWYVWAIDDTGARTSPVVEVNTDDVNCHPGGGGHQIARLVFVKR